MWAEESGNSLCQGRTGTGLGCPLSDIRKTKPVKGHEDPADLHRYKLEAREAF